MDGTSLLARAGEYRATGWRLALINATTVLPTDDLPDGAFDMAWMFARDRETELIRERVLPGEEVPSISALYGGAFLYENEARELFGINYTGIEVDLRGQLYQTAERVPFAPSAIRARIEASRPAPAHKAAPAAAPAGAAGAGA
jgi:ech hydrogenase subunit D